MTTSAVTARRWPLRLALGAGALLLAIQLVPYGRDHSNPPVGAEPNWSSPEVRALAVRACYDCHSNTTVWPWYSNVAPVSWLLQRDTVEGRRKLNFTEWERPQKKAKDAAEEVSEGEMPMWIYSAMHAQARLTPAETKQLSDGLTATVGGAAGGD
jgi:hypothetical protein